MSITFSIKKAALAALDIALVLIALLGVKDPMWLIFPLWLFTYLFKEKLEEILDKLPGSAGFVVAGITFGMLFELFAIMNNLDKPMKERLLLDGVPKNDLILGLFYYAFVIISWYFLLRKIQFLKRDIFFITGIYGIMVEETGQVALRVLTQPIMGTLYAIFVMFVYGLFPLLALMVAGKRFPANRRKSTLGMRALALAVLFGQVAVYGNTVYPLLKALL